MILLRRIALLKLRLCFETIRFRFIFRREADSLQLRCDREPLIYEIITIVLHRRISHEDVLLRVFNKYLISNLRLSIDFLLKLYLRFVGKSDDFFYKTCWLGFTFTFYRSSRERKAIKESLESLQDHFIFLKIMISWWKVTFIKNLVLVVKTGNTG